MKRDEYTREIKNGLPPIHPGELLLDELEYTNVDRKRFAEMLAVPFEQLQAFLSGERDVDAEFALRLERYFGSGARMWMNIQTDYSLKMADRELGKTISDEVVPREKDPSEIVEAA